MERLACLPVFFTLEKRRTLVAGGNTAATWKAELLSAAGADVSVFAEAPSDDMLALAEMPPGGSVTLHRRPWKSDDFVGATLAVGAFEDEREAERFAAAAHAAKVPVNVVDKPAYCDFSFGSIVNRSPLVVGISTEGAAPALAQALRARIEGMIPRGFVHWAAVARRWRQSLKTSGLSLSARQCFWQFFAARALANSARVPSQSDFDACLNAVRTEQSTPERGSVTLVGAGPGDPELLTLRAVRTMQTADVILFDDLVAPAILDFARREARKMLVGKTGHAPSCKQNDINTLMVTLAKAGRRVVRLKGGDPMIFGRAGEEIEACRKAGVTIDVVPGISAAQGAASRLGVSLTQRPDARRVQFVTGHGQDGRLPRHIEWQSLADPATTTVIYMPAKTLSELVTTAIAQGLDPATPAVAIANATRPDEMVVTSAIASLPAKLATLPQGPLIVMIGRVFAKTVLPACETGRPRELFAAGH